MYDSITDVDGITVGHYTNRNSATGCTVVMCEDGAVGGVDVRGSAPGTRETDLLRPMNMIKQVHAILLSGGSAFGLDAAGGVLRYLEERGKGFPVGSTTVPIVPAAIIFDLGIQDYSVRPGPEEGYKACSAATSGRVPQGTVGAGTGATVGKILGMERSVKGGLGVCSVKVTDTIVVGALVVVNALGNIVDPNNGDTLAGPRRTDGPGFLDTIDLLVQGNYQMRDAMPENTTIGVVATNATLDKEQTNKLALHAHDGLAMAVRPCHLMRDGDVFFSLATCRTQEVVDIDRLGAAVIAAVSKAISNAINEATSLGGVPAAAEVRFDKS